MNNNKIINNTLNSNKITPKTLRVVMYILIAATVMYCLNAVSIVTRDAKSPISALLGYYAATLMFTVRYKNDEIKTAKIILAVSSVLTCAAIIAVSVIMKFNTHFRDIILNSTIGAAVLVETVFALPKIKFIKNCSETLFWIIFGLMIAILPSVMLTLSVKNTLIAETALLIIVSVFLTVKKH